MKKYSFRTTALLSKNQEPLTILEVCQSLIRILSKLAEIDSVFSEFEISSMGTSNVCYEIMENISDAQIDDLAKKLALDILEYARNDIKQHDNEPNPTLEFKRAVGFNHNFRFIQQGKRLTGSFGLGRSTINTFMIDYSAKDVDRSFSYGWHESIVKALVDNFEPEYVHMTLKGLELHDERRELGLLIPLGLMTYIDDVMLIGIPDSVEKASVQKYSNGKLVLFSKDDTSMEQITFDELGEILKAGTRQLIPYRE